MATLDLAKAANRHKRCADQLAGNKEEAEGCYLMGLAAECALKMFLQQSGFQLERSKRKAKKKIDGPDPLYLHFPHLTTELLEQGRGIIQGKILVHLSGGMLLKGWNVRMRYCDATSSPQVRAQYQRWKTQTEALFQEVGI